MEKIKNYLRNIILFRRAWAKYKIASIYVRLYFGCFLHKIMEFLSKIRNFNYPTTLQLPITYKCNFNCVMCGMRQESGKQEFSVQELKGILDSKLFKRIRSVGINGGEPFLLDNLVDYVDVVIRKLPNLKNLYIISNGFFVDNISKDSARIFELCKNSNIRYHLSISVDGFGDMQNIHRGNKNAWHTTQKTIELLKTKKLSDDFGLICTLTKINIYNLPLLENWAKKVKVPVSFNVATIHERINNSKKFENFSLMTDEKAKKVAAEFFYSKFLYSNSQIYFALYYYLRYGKRIGSCNHRMCSVTIIPNGNIAYCATYSKELGSTLDTDAKEIYFHKDNLKYKKDILFVHCDHCSHYMDNIKFKYFYLYVKEMAKKYNNYF